MNCTCKVLFEKWQRPFQASKIDPEDLSGEKPEKVIGEIEFKGVSFVYPTRKDVQVLSMDSVCHMRER